MTTSDIENPESIQAEGARIIIGATRLISLQNLYRESGLELLQERRRQHKLNILFYKMYPSLCSPYLSDLIPTSVERSTVYSVRNADDIRNMHCRSQLMVKYILPSTFRSWNVLPDKCRRSPSLSTFKSNFKKQNIPAQIPPYYYVGDRAQNIHHARLRMNCSPLKAQLFSKNIIDSPLCQWGVIEDIYQYFFDSTQRDTPAASAESIISWNYFNPRSPVWMNLSSDTNITIFRHVHTFIRYSKRF